MVPCWERQTIHSQRMTQLVHCIHGAHLKVTACKCILRQQFMRAVEAYIAIMELIDATAKRHLGSDGVLLGNKDKWIMWYPLKRIFLLFWQSVIFLQNTRKHLLPNSLSPYLLVPIYAPQLSSNDFGNSLVRDIHLARIRCTRAWIDFFSRTKISYVCSSSIWMCIHMVENNKGRKTFSSFDQSDFKCGCNASISHKNMSISKYFPKKNHSHRTQHHKRTQLNTAQTENNENV